jgi:putative ABC transport system ATP-binding protein
MSGGEQQRVAIARAIVGGPKVILADEPTGNLDSRSGEEIMVIFQELHEQGITIILVTHDPDIARHSERVISLKDGKIISDEMVQDRLDARECLAAMPEPDVSA